MHIHGKFVFQSHFIFCINLNILLQMKQIQARKESTTWGIIAVAIGVLVIVWIV